VGINQQIYHNMAVGKALILNGMTGKIADTNPMSPKGRNKND